ncbi:TLD-domain-containing protein [Durotheca rogersii]|uniref:TLD-domain-containing protein n=1 Tax=Durotheca rogersii TaxID=419775 RepID=UPI002220CF65|nr:TLD-domain-containing protein [Durotheca rogersii]KAI5859925.1 TLD-domain-containing protein [Durotheca rogersii]
MPARQDSNLIDFSPPSSGYSTPVSRPSRSYTPPRPHSRPQSPSQQLSPGNGGGYGFGSAVLGLWRRLSSLETPGSIPPSANADAASPPHSHAHAKLQHTASEPAIFGSTGDGVRRPFIPPSQPPGGLRRTPSPRGLPSLEPLSLSGYHADTDSDERLLTRGLAEQIRTFLPERLKIADSWHLVYSLYQDGSSLATLYKLCEEYRGRRVGFVLVVRDGKDATFGAYLTEAPHPAPSYFGTGECFLWRASLHPPLPPPPSADTTNINYRTATIASPAADSLPPPPATQPPGHHLAPGAMDPGTGKLAPPQSVPAHSIRFQNFAYTGANDYCIFCETKFLSVGGGGGGRYGLWLNDSLSLGHSAPCDTFLNQSLSDEGEKFDVFGVELWVIGAS